jgi:hypothetical protein
LGFMEAKNVGKKPHKFPPCLCSWYYYKSVENNQHIIVLVVTYSQFDSNIRVFYVFLGFKKNILKYFIQRPIFKPLYFYNDFFKILENISFWAPSKNTRISYVTTMIIVIGKVSWLLGWWECSVSA